MPTATSNPGTILLTCRSHTATPRQLARAVHGAWARIARENTLRGIHAFSELVPRDHESGLRWRTAGHHLDYHRAAFEHDSVNIIGFIESGKSEQMTLVRTAWEIGQNPNLRNVIVGATADAATDRVQAIRELLETKDYRAVFPNVRKSPVAGAAWGKEKFTVERRNLADQNPAVQAIGLFNKKLGYRVDRACIDDVIQFDNSRTADMRDKVTRWLKGTVISRMTRRARWVNVQNAWHKDDFGHVLEREGVHTLKHPVRMKDGRLRWHARFDDAWEAKKRRELGVMLAPGLLDCKPRSDETSRFKEDWLRKVLKAGVGRTFVRQARTNDEWLIVVGVDLGVGLQARNDKTSLSTVVGNKKGECALLSKESGRWKGPDIVERIVDHARRYPAARILVENNAAQEYLAQYAREAVAYVESYTTGSRKADPTFGVEGPANEFYQGCWAFPCEWVNDETPLNFDAHPEVEQLVEDCFDHVPGQHVGDGLMSLWLAREGLRMGSGPVEVVDLRRW